MKKVYVLSSILMTDYDDKHDLIGIFSTKKKANDAMRQMFNEMRKIHYMENIEEDTYHIKIEIRDDYAVLDKNLHCDLFHYELMVLEYNINDFNFDSIR